jgi:hypothetical protein
MMDTHDSDNPTVLIAHHPPPQLQQAQPQQLAQSQAHAQADHHQHQHQHYQHQPLQLSEPQQSTPPRQYTTVGSIYNPQPQPLQPPVRRGRTVKALFPYKSESPAGPSQLQYTPLQQNADRAVSPVRLSPRSLPSTVTDQEREVLHKFGIVVSNIQQTPNMSRHLQSPIRGNSGVVTLHNYNYADDIIDAVADPAITSNLTMVADTDTDPDSESDGADVKSISAMNINSITNLASYPNPNQRAAQKLLASHRPPPVPVTGVSTTDAAASPNNKRTLKSSWID